MSPNDPIGIVAGGGSLPGEIARSLAARNIPMHVIWVEGSAEPELKAYPHTVVNWASLGRAVAALRSAGVSDVLFVGKTARPVWRTARPDFTFLAALPAVIGILKAGGDDAVLRGLLALFEKKGFQIAAVGEIAPELLVERGHLAGPSPNARDDGDIAKGLALVAALGRHDIGQGAIVSGGIIEAIEGAEGTDRMIARVAERRRAGGGDPAKVRAGVLVKRPKPGQDLRVDLPAIGPDTVAAAARAGLSGLAVMAGHVLTAQRRELIARANANKLFILGVAGDEPVKAAQVRAPAGVSFDFRGYSRPSAAALVDAKAGVRMMRDLAEFETGSAVLLARGRVLAIGARERPSDVIARWAQFLRAKGRSGVVVIGQAEELTGALAESAAGANVAGFVILTAKGEAQSVPQSVIAITDKLKLFIAETPIQNVGAETVKPLRFFIVAGEPSGDALGAKLIAAVKSKAGSTVAFAGVGGEEMAREGLVSIFPIEDVTVMGPMSILPRLPRIIRRVHQTVAAALSDEPDAVIIIDSPEFTHPIAKRIRAASPNIPIIDYVSPSVWAWRPGRAKRMRPYIDEVLALLPFEPQAHVTLGGPHCTYVGHPLIERLDEIRNADAAGLARRLNLDQAKPVLLVLPGSRRSEVDRLIGVFGSAVSELARTEKPFEVVIPAVAHVREKIAAESARWAVKTHVVDGAEKYAAMRLARAALAASGTVTLELALAGTPMVVAYKVDRVIAAVRFLIKTPSVILANLILGENAFPEFLQEAATAQALAGAVRGVMADGPVRDKQIAALARIPQHMTLPGGAHPSNAAAEAVLKVLRGRDSNH